MNMISTTTTPTEKNRKTRKIPLTAKCRQCRKERTIIAKIHGDPFCSNDCCRKAHNNPIPKYDWGMHYGRYK